MTHTLCPCANTINNMRNIILLLRSRHRLKGTTAAVVIRQNSKTYLIVFFHRRNGKKTDKRGADSRLQNPRLERILFPLGKIFGIKCRTGMPGPSDCVGSEENCSRSVLVRHDKRNLLFI